MSIEGYKILVLPYRHTEGGPSGGPWLIRCYRRTGEHIRSCEGGVPLDVGLREVGVWDRERFIGWVMDRSGVDRETAERVADFDAEATR